MTALEMQFAAVNHLRKHGAIDSPLHGHLIDEQIKALRSAGTYNWTGDATTAVQLASRTIPDSTMLREVALDHAGWWWFGKNGSGQV